MPNQLKRRPIQNQTLGSGGLIPQSQPVTVSASQIPQPMAGYTLPNGQFVQAPDTSTDPTIRAQSGGQIAVPRPYGGNSTLQQTPVLAPTNQTASQSNDAAGQRQQTWNSQAALQNAVLRQYQIQQSQQQNALGQQTTENQRAYHALGSALGVDTTPPKDVWDEQTQKYYRPKVRPPSFDQLKGQFYDLPTPEQAQIYASGSAPFIDPESGAKLLQAGQKERESSMIAQINTMGQSVAKGEITYNPADNKMYQVMDDPDHPETGLKKKVPLTPMQASIINEGMKRKMIPDIVQQNRPPPDLGDDNYDSIANQSTPSPMVPTSLPVDTATALGQSLRNNLANAQGSLGVPDFAKDAYWNLGGDLLNAGKTIYNSVNMPVNAVKRFGNALLDINMPQTPTFQQTPPTYSPLGNVDQSLNQQPAPGEDAQQAQFQTSQALWNAKWRQQQQQPPPPPLQPEIPASNPTIGVPVLDRLNNLLDKRLLHNPEDTSSDTASL